VTTTDGLLRRGIEGAGHHRVVVLDPAFQGLPDTAHGGSVLAVFDAVAALDGPRVLAGRYVRRVPLGLPLALAVARDGDGTSCTLTDQAGGLLVEGRVDVAADAPVLPPAAVTADGLPLPVSRGCLACGVDNPVGLRARLVADDCTVSATWTPRPPLQAHGGLAPVALTTLLDETAFWLGALATGESGMTTELDVTLRRIPAADADVTVWGERALVRPRPDDARYWDTRVEAWDGSGAVASARITFVAVRGAARRLVAALRSFNPSEVVQRVFPAYTG
jgi:hypothetical protein